MLAEIYMLRLEAAARAAKQGATSSSQFVPVSLPAVKASSGVRNVTRPTHSCY